MCVSQYVLVSMLCGIKRQVISSSLTSSDIRGGDRGAIYSPMTVVCQDSVRIFSQNEGNLRAVLVGLVTLDRDRIPLTN